MRPITNIRGFTLVELVIAISVLALLVSLSAPMYGSFTSTNRARSAAYSLVSALTFARSEAIKRNAPVSVSPLGSGWQEGWEVEAAGTTLATTESEANLVLTGPLAGVSYLPNGRLSTPGVVLFTVAAASGTTRCVVIDLGGRPTLNPGERNDGSCV